MQEVDYSSNVGVSIAKELAHAKAHLEPLEGPVVAVFGSARIREGHPYFSYAEALSAALSSQGYHILTGGGPGLMEAANRGAAQGPGKSIGLNIVLPFEAGGNPYQDVRLSFDRFAARKVVFAKYASAFVVMPGGVGTLDELFEIATLIQCQKTQSVPIFLFGTAFWGGLLKWMEDSQLQLGLINRSDLDRFILVDTVDELTCLLRSKLAYEPGALTGDPQEG